MRADPVDPGRAARVGLLLGASAFFANMYSTQGILPELATDLQATPTQTGLTIGIVVWGLALGAWFAGPLSDRIGRRRVLVASCALIVVPTLAVGFAPSINALLVARLLQGLCMPGLLTVGTAFIREAFPARSVPSMLGIYTTALVAGGMTGRLGVALLADVVGWRVAIGALALPTAAAALLMSRALPPEPVRPRDPQGLVAAVRGHLRTRSMRLVLCVGPPLFFVFQAVFSYVAYRLVDPPFNLTAAQTGLLFALWVTGLGGPLVGRHAGRVGAERLLVPIVLVISVGLAMTAVDSLVPIVIGLGIATMAMFASHTCCQIVLAHAAETDRGAATSLYMSLYYTAGGLGAIAPGPFWHTGAWSSVLAIIALPLALALAGALGLYQLVSRSSSSATA